MRGLSIVFVIAVAVHLVVSILAVLKLREYDQQQLLRSSADIQAFQWKYSK